MAEHNTTRQRFGTRFIADGTNIFDHNAWDEVHWDEEMEMEARNKVSQNSGQKIPWQTADEYEQNAANYWNKFYGIHDNKFFKDRQWLFTEFPELAPRSNGLESAMPDVEGTCIEDTAVRDASNFQQSSGHCCGCKDDCGSVCSGEYLVTDSATVLEPTLDNNVRHSGATEIEDSDLSVRSKKWKNLLEDTDGCLEDNFIKSVRIQDDGIRSDCVGKKVSSSSVVSGSICHVDCGYPGAHADKRVLEVGCGVGNTMFPLLQTNNDNGLFVYGCDFSAVAVDIVRGSDKYDPQRCLVFQCDVTEPSVELPFPPGSLDVIVMIFVLSAINPDRMLAVLQHLSVFLRPGGCLLLRDYGRYDMAQLRFKPGRCLSENFYVRGDGTRVYFFTEEELDGLFTKAGLVKGYLWTDRRLQVNRIRKLKMYRIWVQCKYMKL